MHDPVDEYLHELERALARRNATEHTHRPALKQLLEAIAPGIVATNEPRRVDCGAPDFSLARRSDGLTVGHLEAKDVGANLDEVERSEQLARRYLPALPNLVLTDYREFRWYVDGKPRARHRLDEDPAATRRMLEEFLGRDPLRITGAVELAERLARLGHLIRDAIVEAFRLGEASTLSSDWREVFAATLLPELAEPGHEAEFADMFAQTLAYGLFSARALTSSSRRFTMADAAKLIPRTNPFLRDFFDLVTGPKLDDEPFAGYVQDLVSLLDAADMYAILEDFGRGVGAGRGHDPVVHFYETFLAAYDNKLRKVRGVFYTPEPVVEYIVRSVDQLLKDELGIKDGLADRSTINVPAGGGEGEGEGTTHRVLVLDPATGTGTFLFEVIEHIRSQFERKHQAGAWQGYVHEHLLPRLFGFELLMAPYAVAHLKIGLELSARHLAELWRKTWRYDPHPNERVNIFLTNTLEDVEHVTRQLGPLSILSREAEQANAIKRRRPVLVVLGNPPYSNYGRQNRNEFILGLLKDYKKGLAEKKLNLDDDFIKFVRWAQWRIERTGSGIIGFITNNVYLDGLVHRRMRESLLESFDNIYLVDLHGSSKKQEKTPDGGKDENVFDIQVGVAIALFVKRPGEPEKKRHAKVHHADLWGSRDDKYAWLKAHDVASTPWRTFEPDKPEFLFRPRDAAHEKEWNAGWGLKDAFVVSGNGVKTERDGVSIHFSAGEASKAVRDFRTLSDAELRRKYDLGPDSRDWSIERARKDVLDHRSPKLFLPILYRPFDFRHTWYSSQSKGFIGTPAGALMRHLTGDENVALVTTRQTKDEFGVLVTDGLAGHKSCAAYDINTVFPLYLLPNGDSDDQGQLVTRENGRQPNFSKSFIAACETALGLELSSEAKGRKTFTPEDLFHFVYAVLHSSGYRTRYLEFLKRDFPRIPLTTDPGLFRRLARMGKDLVALHTMKEQAPDTLGFDVPGSNMVEEVLYVPAGKTTKGRRGPHAPGPTGRVYINAEQCFDGVTPAVWEMRIGGYQVAEKWLKDRKGRELTHDDVEHYQRTLGALAETRRLMAQIDAVIQDHGGWPLS